MNPGDGVEGPFYFLVFSKWSLDSVPWDHNNRRALIIEAKKSDKESDLDKDCDEAIDQIIRGKYAEGFYGYEQILCYGIAFFQKQAKVKLQAGK